MFGFLLNSPHTLSFSLTHFLLSLMHTHVLFLPFRQVSKNMAADHQRQLQDKNKEIEVGSGGREREREGGKR